jgi:MFS family permease
MTWQVRWPLLIITLALLRFACAGAFTCVFIVINNSVERSERATAQGLAMMGASVSRGAGPVIGAVSFAWSLTNGYHVPGLGVRFVFLMSAAVVIATWLLTLRLPHSYNHELAQRTEGSSS